MVRISPSANLSLPSFLFNVPVPSRDTSIPPSINTSLSFFLSFSLTHIYTHTFFSTSRHYPYRLSKLYTTDPAVYDHRPLRFTRSFLLSFLLAFLNIYFYS